MSTYSDLFTGKRFRIMKALPDIFRYLTPSHEIATRKISLDIFSEIEIGPTISNGDLVTYVLVGRPDFSYPIVVFGVDLNNAISAGYLKEVPNHSPQIETFVEFGPSRLAEIE